MSMRIAWSRSMAAASTTARRCRTRTRSTPRRPVLFELVRRGALPRAKEPLAEYEHIVVDEAQLRAPMELAAIGDALAPHGTITLAGDHRQATDESAWFTGWEAARAELHRPRWVETTLAITYRSVPAISDLGRAITEGTAQVPAEPPADPAVWASACGTALAQAAALCWHLDALITREPWRQIAVIARTPEHARRLHAELSRGLDPVLVLDGDFRFEPGLIVTTAAAVSGLEFDAVVIPDLTPAFYPVSPELARSLYVAATRARDWLWLLTPTRGRRSSQPERRAHRERDAGREQQHPHDALEPCCVERVVHPLAEVEPGTITSARTRPRSAVWESYRPSDRKLTSSAALSTSHSTASVARNARLSGSVRRTT